MAVTLQDPTRQRDPSSRHAFPDIVGEPKMIASPTLAEELLAAPRAARIEQESGDLLAGLSDTQG